MPVIERLDQLPATGLSLESLCAHRWSARFEVTALGDEVNEAARIEACATGGRTLASKSLVERLDDQAASELGTDRDRLTYTQLSDLPTATEKARRDAPAIAVCEL